VNVSAILKGFALCSIVYPQTFGILAPHDAEASAVIWSRLLDNVSDERGERAFEEHCRRSHFPPTPADVRTIAAEMRDEDEWEHRAYQTAQIGAPRVAGDLTPIGDFVERYKAKRKAETFARARGPVPYAVHEGEES
jgi:hypothetical protein